MIVVMMVMKKKIYQLLGTQPGEKRIGLEAMDNKESICLAKWGLKKKLNLEVNKSQVCYSNPLK